MHNQNIRLLSYFNFLIGFSLFAPLAIIYFSKVSGSYTLGTSIFGLAMLASAIFELPTGIISDKVGRRFTIVFGSWSRLIAFILYAVGINYWWLAVGAIFEGLSRAFYSGNNNALLYDTLDDDGLVDEYAKYLGITSSTEQLALAFSAALGGIIANISFSYLMWLSVFAQIILVILSYKFIEPRSRKINENIYQHLKDAIKLFITNKKLRLLSIASIISYSTSELTFQFRGAFFSTVWPLWAIGFSNVLSNLGASASFYYSEKILKNISFVKFMLIRNLYGKASYFLGLILTSIASPIIMSTSSLLFGAGEVAESKLMQQEFSDHQRATMSSLNSLGGSIGFAIMSLFLGGLADNLGPRIAMIIMIFVSLPSTFIYWNLFKNQKQTS